MYCLYEGPPTTAAHHLGVVMTKYLHGICRWTHLITLKNGHGGNLLFLDISFVPEEIPNVVDPILNHGRTF